MGYACMHEAHFMVSEGLCYNFRKLFVIVPVCVGQRIALGLVTV